MTLENKIYQAMASNQPLANNSIIVIGPHYSTPHQVDLYVARKVLNVTEGNNLGVFEINGNNIFKVKSAGKRRILVDAAGVPIVSLEEKVSYIQISSSITISFFPHLSVN